MSRHTTQIKSLLDNKMLNRSRFNPQSSRKLLTQLKTKKPKEQHKNQSYLHGNSHSSSHHNLPPNKPESLRHSSSSSNIKPTNFFTITSSQFHLLQQRYLLLQNQYRSILQQTKQKSKQFHKQKQQLQKLRQQQQKDKKEIERLRMMLGFVKKVDKEVQVNCKNGNGECKYEYEQINNNNSNNNNNNNSNNNNNNMNNMNNNNNNSNNTSNICHNKNKKYLKDQQYHQNKYISITSNSSSFIKSHFYDKSFIQSSQIQMAQSADNWKIKQRKLSNNSNNNNNKIKNHINLSKINTPDKNIRANTPTRIINSKMTQNSMYNPTNKINSININDRNGIKSPLAKYKFVPTMNIN